MKKVLAICLVLAMLIGVNVNVFAAPGGFVSSPSGNPAPILVSFDPADEGCTAKLVITPYAERDNLPAESKALFEAAYASIANAEDLTDLCAALANLVANKNMKLAVSDLFDVSAFGCEEHDGHHTFRIVLDADTLNKFVGLLHMKQDGEWELIKNAKVISNGQELEFTVDSLSPFAVVINAGENVPDGPQTGDNNMASLYIIVMAASALALVLVLVVGKKKHA